MKNITDVHYNHAKAICKGFEIKKRKWISWFVPKK